MNDLSGEFATEAESEFRALLSGAVPDFLDAATVADRALAGARRKRRWTRAAGGTGALAAVATGVLVVSPLAGWGAASAGGKPTAAAPGLAAADAKSQAVERVKQKLGAAHRDAFMGVDKAGLDDETGRPVSGSIADQYTLVVYRVPDQDPTLEADAEAAAQPYHVVFRDSVLNLPQQWELVRQLSTDRGYWQQQGIDFSIDLRVDGTIMISTPDPAHALPLIEQHYGYDGRVFKGRGSDRPGDPAGSGMVSGTVSVPPGAGTDPLGPASGSSGTDPLNPASGAR